LLLSCVAGMMLSAAAASAELGASVPSFDHQSHANNNSSSGNALSKLSEESETSAAATEETDDFDVRQRSAIL